MKKQSFYLLISLLASLLFISSCGSDSDPEISKPQTHALTSASSRVAAVQSSFAPDSLSTSESSYSTLSYKMLSQPENPCEGMDLWDCQPFLLNLYIEFARIFLGLAQEIIDNMGRGIGALEVGSSGNFNDSGFEYHFSRPSQDALTVLILLDGESVNYINIDGDDITLKFNIQNSDNSNSLDGIQVNLIYNNENDWEVTVYALGINECDPNDPRAPESIYVHMKHEESLWSGKASMYHPRWGEENPECGASLGEGELGILTDFIGDNDAAKVEVYFVPESETSTANVKNGDYEINQICENFPICETPIEDREIPYCNPSNTMTALWNNNCSSISTDVSESNFGPAANWIMPRELRDMNLDLPTSI